MKLAEALQERADLNRRIQQLRARLVENAVVQEGELPAENPQELLGELDRCLDELEALVTRINRTNCTTQADGKSLTEHLSRRDALNLRLQAYRELTAAASRLGHRVMGSEIKVFSTVNVRDMQKDVDQLSKQLRLLDNLIQQTNWNTELL